ncbi:unnamed protein product [Rotaria sordida]|uniref:Uncharacterized protein n=1 Tax=Rotaria sordida TaxID=392033 RepID=A0A814WRR4_9BILA|nr:unnamed protein product [Rotaria sordida]
MAAWNSGLFNCFDDCGICLYGYCCAPCLFGENAEKIDGIHMGKREALRNRYGLEEDCNDCLATTFCAPCAICQEARELKYRSAAPGGPTPVITQPMGINMHSPNGQPGNTQPTYEQPGMIKQGLY